MSPTIVGMPRRAAGTNRMRSTGAPAGIDGGSCRSPRSRARRLRRAPSIGVEDHFASPLQTRKWTRQRGDGHLQPAGDLGGTVHPAADRVEDWPQARRRGLLLQEQAVRFAVERTQRIEDEAVEIAVVIGVEIGAEFGIGVSAGFRQPQAPLGG